MSQNHIYAALESNVQEQARLIMVAAFSGAGAIAGLANAHHRQLGYAAKIAMTTLNIEQRYPDQFPPPALPPLGNAIIREIQAGDRNGNEDNQANIATRLVSSVEAQNFAGNVLAAADHVPTHSRLASYAPFHPNVQKIAQYIKADTECRQGLSDQANGWFERLPASDAEALHNDIANGREVAPSQRSVIAELSAMKADQVDQVFRMAQTDLTGIVMAGETIIASDHDPRIHEGDLGTHTKNLARAITDYTSKPNGLSAIKLYNAAADQVAKMTDEQIDVRIRQSLDLSVRQIQSSQQFQVSDERAQDHNVARLRIASSQREL